MQTDSVIPLTIVSGFLGSGKTTFVNQILNSEYKSNFLIIVNDFGDISLDEKIIDSDDVITFDNGCVCCSLGDNLYEQLSRLLKDECDFEHIIVEASGISDPRSIADLAIAVDKVYLNDIYIFLDAENFLVRAQDHRLESIIKTQLDAATVLIMNKCDLSTHESKLSIYQWLHEYKCSIPIIEAVRANVRVFFDESSKQASKFNKPHNEHQHNLSSFKQNTINLTSALSRDTFLNIVNQYKNKLLRIKGVVYFVDDPETPYVINVVGSQMGLEVLTTGKMQWPSNGWINSIYLRDEEITFEQFKEDLMSRI